MSPKQHEFSSNSSLWFVSILKSLNVTKATWVLIELVLVICEHSKVLECHQSNMSFASLYVVLGYYYYYYYCFISNKAHIPIPIREKTKLSSKTLFFSPCCYYQKGTTSFWGLGFCAYLQCRSLCRSLINDHPKTLLCCIV
jgi:hypothetical protein